MTHVRTAVTTRDCDKRSVGLEGIEHFRFPGEQIKVGAREGKVKGLGKWKCGWVGIEHFRFLGPQIKERQIEGKAKVLAKGKVWVGW